MLGTLLIWIREYRLLFLLFIVLPVTIGSAITLNYDGGGISSFYYVISIVAILLLQAGTISMSRFFDLFFGSIIKELKPIVSDVKGHFRELTRPSAYLAAGCVCLGFCVLIGLFIAVTRSLLLLPIGVIGVGMGMFFTVPPLKQRFSLIGHLAWFLTVPLCAVGAFLVQEPIPSLDALQLHIHTFGVIIAVCLPLALVGTCGNYLLENYRPPEKA